MATVTNEAAILHVVGVENTEINEHRMTRLRPDDYPIYSTKVFIGGIPRNVNADVLIEFFKQFGKNRVYWPHRNCCDVEFPEGFAFVIFLDEHSVRRLITGCTVKHGKLLILLKNGEIPVKVVQVKPWNLNCLEYSMTPMPPSADRYSVFVGGIPRPTTAFELAQLFQQVIGSVVEVVIDVEAETNYPRGSARVIFATREAYLIAIAMHHFPMSTLKDRKVLEIKPYLLSNVRCEVCHSAAGRYLCPELPCLLYYCVRCWFVAHQRQSMLIRESMYRSIQASPNRGWNLILDHRFHIASRQQYCRDPQKHHTKSSALQPRKWWIW